MNQENFLYWLQGMLEYCDIDELDQAEAILLLRGIKEHLALQFNKVTKESKDTQRDITTIITEAIKQKKPDSDFWKRYQDSDKFTLTC